MHLHRDLVAGLDRVRLPALRRDLTDATHFERPLDGLAGLLVHREDMEPSMRIGPFELLDGSRKRHGLLMIEHGEGMVGKRRACECGNRTNQDGFELHWRSPGAMASQV
jgi:hypothetical protein